jgi:uncharacterized protein
VTTDKIGAPTTVTRGHNEFTIAVAEHTVGFAAFKDRGDHRVFLHTEVDHKFEGRGLATILVNEALDKTRDEGLRVVAVCPMVAAFLDKHPEFDVIRDPITDDIETWLLDS